MHQENQRSLAHDLVLPTILFVVLGAMTWAVRGCSGFGAMNGCIFAGVTWGAGWWFIARQPGARQSRPYASGWVILALTLGIGVSGNRGWMQWQFLGGPSPDQFAPGPVPADTQELRLPLAVHCRRAVGRAGGLRAGLVRHPPQDRARRLGRPPGLRHRRRLPGHRPLQTFPRRLSAALQNGQRPVPGLSRQSQSPPPRGRQPRRANAPRALPGVPGVELGRRDWRNATLITTVGLVNGTGWALFQNWSWAHHVWPNFSFNWWRCWESSGGISIGLAYGLAYFLANRPLARPDGAPEAPALFTPCPNCERLGAYIGLLIGLGFSIKNGLKGWANIYLGNEEHWNHVLWMFIGPLMLLGLIALPVWVFWRRPLPAPSDAAPGGAPAAQPNPFPHAYGLIWLVLIVQNVIAQLITGPHSSWDENRLQLLLHPVVPHLRRHRPPLPLRATAKPAIAASFLCVLCLPRETA